jgi:hypothetical protein
MAILVLLNNFLHDFSAAGWIFCTVMLWQVLRKKEAGEGRSIFIHLLKINRLLMRISLGGIIVFGIFRALAYRTYEWNAAAGEGQITLLIVKHIILTVVFVLGVIFYTRAGKLVKKHRDDY